MTNARETCSRCGQPLSDFEKMIAKELGADRVICKSCVKKVEDEWSDLCVNYLEDKLSSEKRARFEELDKTLEDLENAGYYGAIPDNTCPQCGRETLERMNEGSFTRSRCVSCGYDDVQNGS